MEAVDEEIARWIADHRAEPITRLCQLLEDIGTSYVTFLVLGLVVLGVVVRLRWWTLVLDLGIAFAILLPVNGNLKRLFDRPRPSAELAITVLEGPAMPSSHAVITSAVVVSIVLGGRWTSRRWQRAAAVVGGLGCVLEALAMMYLGGHWLSDVLVGWALGGSVAATVVVLRQRWQTWHRSSRGQ